jgi:hypothetical protein
VLFHAGTKRNNFRRVWRGYWFRNTFRWLGFRPLLKKTDDCTLCLPLRRAVEELRTDQPIFSSLLTPQPCLCRKCHQQSIPHLPPTLERAADGHRRVRFSSRICLGYTLVVESCH